MLLLVLVVRGWRLARHVIKAFDDRRLLFYAVSQLVDDDIEPVNTLMLRQQCSLQVIVRRFEKCNFRLEFGDNLCLFLMIHYVVSQLMGTSPRTAHHTNC